jgi:3-deoxy-manno-octulosonate cytidylyltransferase (CMP-KDO synthetase)
VVSDNTGKALYFSRSPIPHIRNVEQDEWLNQHTFYKHIGMYGYRSDILEQITKLGISPLEQAESLEQLRWLENGYHIRIAETELETIGIDTPEDLKKAVLFLSKT